MLLGAERVLVAGDARSGVILDIDDSGRITAVGDTGTLGAPERMLDGRLLIPGLSDAHVDVVARACPGGSDPRPEGFLADRRAAYKIATALDATGLRAIARYQFVEMLRAGITSVGAVLTVHHRPDGSPYRDPSTMADALALAARDAGMRMCLLRSVRLRGDFERPAEGPERREVDPSVDAAAVRIAFSARRLSGYGDPRLTVGVAVGSLATVPPDAMIALKTRLAHVPFHAGAATDLAESLTCQTLFGAGPVELLVRAGVVDGCTTLVGLTTLRPGELELLVHTGGVAYSEAPEMAAELEAAGVTVAMPVCAAGTRLDRVTTAGGIALAQRSGRIAPGHWADLVALDLEELGDTPPTPARLPVREVLVGGQIVVADGDHPGAANAAAGYTKAVTRLS
jgi:cytosine/adenosine deaminase-related metal-dependent hydrolase